MVYSQYQTSNSRSKWIPALIALSAAVAILAAFFATRTFAAGNTVVVTPSDSQGWTTSPPADNRPVSSVTFTEEFGAPAGYNQGSLKVVTVDGSAKAQYMKVAPTGTMLSDVNDAAYSTYRSSASTGSAVQVAAMNVAVDVNGSAPGGFTTLVFEPVYQVASQGPIVNDTWQNWDAGNSSIWWSSNPIPGAPNRDTFVPLATIKANNPDAVVLYYGVNQGSGNAGITSGVDAFRMLGTTYDFELVAPLTNKDQCKDGGYATYGFKNQGQCVAFVQSSPNSAVRR